MMPFNFWQLVTGSRLALDPPAPPPPVIKKPAMHSLPARYYGGERLRTSLFIWHCTAGESFASSISWQNRDCKPEEKSSYHFGIDRDGRITASAPLTHTAYHAGLSEWPNPRYPIPSGSVNTRSIGIAFANRDVPKASIKFERITFEQIEAARDLVQWLGTIYPAALVAKNHLRHRDVAPKRKVDALPDVLDWKEFVPFLLNPPQQVAA